MLLNLNYTPDPDGDLRAWVNGDVERMRVTPNFFQANLEDGVLRFGEGA